MRRLLPLLLLGALLPLVPACQSLGSGRENPELERLADWMTGSFSSAAQHEADPDNFFDIRLRMMPIWTDRHDGPWLYVEQAAASALDKPYRQRVYHLVQDAGCVRSDVYTLPGDPLDFAAPWEREEDVFASVHTKDLTERTGCSIFLTSQSDGTFIGSTRGHGCESSLRGAAYATSEVLIDPGVVTSWDRGYDADGQQAWGARVAPYRFDKL